MYRAKEPIIISWNDTSGSFVKPLGLLVFTLSIRVQDESGAPAHEHIFKTEATAGPKVFDISSAFRAEFLRQEDLSPSNLSYKPLEGVCTLKLEWLQDGTMHSISPTASGEAWVQTFRDVYQGGLSDEQRYLGFKDSFNAFSLKPTTGEVVGINEPYYLLHGSSSSLIHTGETEGVKTIDTPERTIYVEDNPQRVCFAFKNSFGLIESASAVMQETKSLSIGREKFGLVGTPSYIPGRKAKAKVNKRQHTWKMSSGFNTRDWIEWWAAEFACSECHWMWIEGKWLPVSIDTGNEITIYDKAKGELVSVDFTVESYY